MQELVNSFKEHFQQNRIDKNFFRERINKDFNDRLFLFNFQYIARFRIAQVAKTTQLIFSLFYQFNKLETSFQDFVIQSINLFNDFVHFLIVKNQITFSIVAITTFALQVLAFYTTSYVMRQTKLTRTHNLKDMKVSTICDLMTTKIIVERFYF